MLILNPYGFQLLELSGGKASLAGFYSKPILISETEKIEVGDWYLYNGQISQRTRKNPDAEYPSSHYKKILALPEHFSPKHLQAIVDGKLKDDDEVYVECVDRHYCTNAVCCHVGHCYREDRDYTKCENTIKELHIKLNSSNHITLHKIEERTYTKEELRAAFDAGYQYGLEVERSGIYAVGNCFEEWFDVGIIPKGTR